jgi:hypothetical protein
VGLGTAALGVALLALGTVVFVAVVLPLFALKGLLRSLQQLPRLVLADRDAAAAANRRAQRARTLFVWDEAMIRNALAGVHYEMRPRLSSSSSSTAQSSAEDGATKPDGGGSGSGAGGAGGNATGELTMEELSAQLAEFAESHRRLLATVQQQQRWRTAARAGTAIGAGSANILKASTGLPTGGGKAAAPEPAAPAKVDPGVRRTAAGFGGTGFGVVGAVAHWRMRLPPHRAASEEDSRAVIRDELRRFISALNEPPPDERGPSMAADVLANLDLSGRELASELRQRRASSADDMYWRRMSNGSGGLRRARAEVSSGSGLLSKSARLCGEGNAALLARKARLEALRATFEALVVHSRNPIRWALLLQQEIGRFSFDKWRCPTAELRRFLQARHHRRSIQSRMRFILIRVGILSSCSRSPSRYLA